MSAAPAPELDAEQEVDFSRYLRAVVSRWWLLLAGVIAGAIIGYLATLGQGGGYSATASVYLGNPLAPGGGAPVTSAPTSLALVTSYITATTTLRKVAVDAGLPKQYLDNRVTTKPILGVTGAKVGVPAPLLAITVDGAPAAKVVDAADRLAALAAGQLSGYARVKEQQQQQHLDYDQAQLAKITTQIASAQEQQRRLLAPGSTLGAAERLIAVQGANQLLQFLQQRQQNLEADQFTVRQQLKLAQDIESGRVYSEASATRSAGPSRRSGVIIGAVIGLILGILAALLWEPLSRSWSRANASPS